MGSTSPILSASNTGRTVSRDDFPNLKSLTYDLVAAVVVFGDPSFTASQSFDRGTSTEDGVFARSEDGDSLALLNTYASVLRSYCDENDTFCASGDSLDVHYAEVANHAQEAANFVASLA